MGLLAALALVTLPSSGCTLLAWGLDVAWTGAAFFGTTPLIPVTPYFSQQIEDKYWAFTEACRYRTGIPGP